MIVENENYVVDPVVMAAESAMLAKGTRAFIEYMPISYQRMDCAFDRLDGQLDDVNRWLDKANEEGKR
ncbi:hypothetical protein SN811_01490 [Ligilactobacillus agilis]|uniref:Uncharacterized protein n=1 Tax=Ligilactobacillus agilis TaxID=1601 RepID=A0A6F9Y2A3_9LACO|nr:hypothetical protein [Ligilactobacillus agilis]GET11649.1 hypothetical protein SN811_01490 [Ligilactobacillus agilis]